MTHFRNALGGAGQGRGRHRWAAQVQGAQSLHTNNRVKPLTVQAHRRGSGTRPIACHYWKSACETWSARRRLPCPRRYRDTRDWEEAASKGCVVGCSSGPRQDSRMAGMIMTRPKRLDIANDPVCALPSRRSGRRQSDSARHIGPGSSRSVSFLK